MLTESYNFEKEKFEEMYNLCEELFGNIKLLEMYCEENKGGTDEMYLIIPLIRRTFDVADLLYFEFINKKYD